MLKTGDKLWITLRKVEPCAGLCRLFGGKVESHADPSIIKADFTLTTKIKESSSWNKFLR